jgi:glycine/D-amino acid oxidase-like deaminating enzyme
LQYEIDTPLSTLIQLVGKDHAVRAYKRCLEAIYKIERLVEEVGEDCSFAWKKSVYLASLKKDVPGLREEYQVRREHGIRVDYLEQADVEHLFSFSRPAALLSYEAGEVDAYRLTYALIRTSLPRGLRVYDRTEVTRYDHTRRGVTLTTERGCQVQARKVVFATGYESQTYLTQKVVRLKSTYALASEPLATTDGWYKECLLWETARPYFYLRTTSDGRAVMGGADEDFVNPTRRDRLIRRKTATLARKFKRLFPAIEMDVAYAWAGTFGETKDGLAYIGETGEFPNGYFALGFGGNGITFSVVAAEIVRDLFLGHPNPDAAIFRFDR